jgi:hypothetical protein
VDSLLKEITDLFPRAHPATQFFILLALIIALIVGGVMYFKKRWKVEELRVERGAEKVKVGERDLLISELKGKFKHAEDEATRHRQDLDSAKTEQGRLSEAHARADKALAETKEQLERCRLDLEAQQYADWLVERMRAVDDRAADEIIARAEEAKKDKVLGADGFKEFARLLGIPVGGTKPKMLKQFKDAINRMAVTHRQTQF